MLHSKQLGGRQSSTFTWPLQKWFFLMALWGSVFFYTPSSLSATTLVPEGHFESPSLKYGTFLYRPPLTASWTYFGGSGVSANNSGFTNGNPPAPQGKQVLFLQRTGFVRQTLALSAGAYSFSFKAAQRGNLNQGGQTFTLTLNGQLLGTFTPDGTNYQSFNTAVIKLPVGGNFLLELRGTNPIGGDNTVFVDDVSYTAFDLWSAPSTWLSGTVPGINTSVTIANGRNVLLDTDANIKNLTINGTLIADPTKDLNLSTNWIMVQNTQGQQALFQWGTESVPYLKKAVITLKHAPGDVLMGPTMKFLAARQGGQVEIHGDNTKKSWTQLDGTVDGTTDVMTLTENPGWEVGDQIVIASTDFNPHQAEVRTITLVQNGGKTLTLDANFKYMHWGDLLLYKGGSLTLDERAEVGLLSRNIKIQGDQLSESTKIGGHTMFMPGSEVRFSGVELYRMGQKDSLARYPFHWHFAGDVTGQYIKDCSIHRSYNRVVTVHGTNYALVEGNVGYDHIGHGYFLEDGNEMWNTFRNNLGILTIAPPEGEGVTPHDRVEGDVGNPKVLKLPATFWITNPENYFVGNVAAGSEGSGFWMVAQENTLGQAPPISPPPGERGLLQFEDNKAHSNSFSNFSIDGQIDRSTNQFVGGHYAPVNPDGSQFTPMIRRFTGYKVKARNVWMRANTIEFHDCALADSPRNTFFAFNQVLLNSLIVGKSSNIGNPATSHEKDAQRSLPHPNEVPNHKWNFFQGHTIYDGPSILVDVHLADFYGTNAAAFKTNGAAQKSPVHQASGITFENVEEDRKVKFRNQSWLETFYASGLIDNDGSITGILGAHITPQIIRKNGADTKIREEGFNIETGAILRSDWKAYINPTKQFGMYRIKNGWNQTTKYPTYNIRSDGPATYGEQKPGTLNQNPVIVNKTDLKYYWQYHKIPNFIKPRLRYVNNNDFVISAYINMPSSTFVYDDESGTVPLEQASSLSQLINGSTQRYFLKDNTIYVKQIADMEGNVFRTGQDYRYVSKEIRLCQLANCASAGGSITSATFADFEQGIDSRIIAEGGGLPTPIIQLNTSNPNDWGISWTMTNDGDQNDDFTQIKFQFPRQVWTDFQYLIINLTGVNRFSVHTKDSGDGFRAIGNFDAGSEAVVPLDPNGIFSHKLDEMVTLFIRIKENQMGGSPATINLLDIKLSLTDPTGGAPQLRRQDLSDRVVPAASLQIFPNPTAGLFTLTKQFVVADELTMEILDIAGKKLGQFAQEVEIGEWSQEFSAEQFGLNPGVYYVMFRTQSHGVETHKLVFQQ